MAEIYEGLIGLAFILRGNVDVYEVNWCILDRNTGPRYALIQRLYCLESRFVAQKDTPTSSFQTGLKGIVPADR